MVRGSLTGRGALAERGSFAERGMAGWAGSGANSTSCEARTELRAKTVAETRMTTTAAIVARWAFGREIRCLKEDLLERRALLRDRRPSTAGWGTRLSRPMRIKHGEGEGRETERLREGARRQNDQSG